MFSSTLPTVGAIGFGATGIMLGNSRLLPSDLFHADTNSALNHAAKDVTDELEEGSKNQNRNKE